MKIDSNPKKLFSIYTFKSDAIWFVLIAFLLIIFQLPVILVLIKDWINVSAYSYGFIIPPLAIFLIWKKCKYMNSIEIKKDFKGLNILTIGICLNLFFIYIQNIHISALFMILNIFLIIRFYYGKEFSNYIALPIGFLVYMIPIPYSFYKFIAAKLRLLDTIIVASSLNLMMIPTYYEGYTLHLPGIKLEVIDACSGVLSLSAMFALGTFYIFISRYSRLQKIFIFSIIFPVTVISNIIRIIITSVLANRFGNIILDSFIHKMYGTINFLISFALIILIGEYINKKYWGLNVQKYME